MRNIFRNISPIILLIFLFGSCSNEIKNSDWTLYKLKGKVKSIRQYSYNNSKFQVDKDRKYNETEISFNSKGKIIECLTFDADGNINSKTITTYYVGYSIDSMFSKPKNLISILRKEYNDKGFVISMHSYNEFQNNQYNEVYKYDDNSNLIETLSYNGDSKLITRIVFKYINKNKLIELRNYNSLNQLEGYEMYDYDKNGHIIKRNYFNSIGALSNINNYQYNQKGDQIEEVSHYLPRDTTIKFNSRYEYDTNENWTKRIVQVNSNTNITVRKITYQ